MVGDAQRVCGPDQVEARLVLVHGVEDCLRGGGGDEMGGGRRRGGGKKGGERREGERRGGERRGE